MFGRWWPLTGRLAMGLLLMGLLVTVNVAVGQDDSGSASDATAPSEVTGQDGQAEPSGDEAPPAAELTAGQPEQAAAPLPVTGLVASLTIFVLAIFVGFEVITKVPPTLHTPLMSGSNAISGITIVGALLVTGSGKGWLPPALGVVALALATINVVGGFLVTHRMLAMFKRKK